MGKRWGRRVEKTEKTGEKDLQTQWWGEDVKGMDRERLGEIRETSRRDRGLERRGEDGQGI